MFNPGDEVEVIRDFDCAKVGDTLIILREDNIADHYKYVGKFTKVSSRYYKEGDNYYLPEGYIDLLVHTPSIPEPEDIDLL